MKISIASYIIIKIILLGVIGGIISLSTVYADVAKMEQQDYVIDVNSFMASGSFEGYDVRLEITNNTDSSKSIEVFDSLFDDSIFGIPGLALLSYSTTKSMSIKPILFGMEMLPTNKYNLLPGESIHVSFGCDDITTQTAKIQFAFSGSKSEMIEVDYARDLKNNIFQTAKRKKEHLLRNKLMELGYKDYTSNTALYLDCFVLNLLKSALRHEWTVASPLSKIINEDNISTSFELSGSLIIIFFRSKTVKYREYEYCGHLILDCSKGKSEIFSLSDYSFLDFVDTGMDKVSSRELQIFSSPKGKMKVPIIFYLQILNGENLMAKKPDEGVEYLHDLMKILSENWQGPLRQ